mmetsp:Transcript_22545/g.56740  ORF Transcript_22545/g.56740 Transcript_22545/m.56740 type:complete len:230 (-) Transcript_22545:55-744(-)
MCARRPGPNRAEPARKLLSAPPRLPPLLLLLLLLAGDPGVAAAKGSVQPTWGSMPKPRVPPAGLGFDMYCKVCRHVFEVAAERVWNFRGSVPGVRADLQRFCGDEPTFANPASTGHQVCPYLIPPDPTPIAKIFAKFTGEESMREAAIRVCYEAHEACTSDGRPPSILGDLRKFKPAEENTAAELEKAQQRRKAEAAETEAERKGPPKVTADHVRKPKRVGGGRRREEL